MHFTGEKDMQDPFQVHDEECRISVDGSYLILTVTEYRLLRTFVTHPRQVFTRDRLLLLCWTDSTKSFDRTVDSHIKNLRKKLLSVIPEKQVIQSVYGLGYRYEVTGLAESPYYRDTKAADENKARCLAHRP